MGFVSSFFIMIWPPIFGVALYWVVSRAVDFLKERSEMLLAATQGSEDDNPELSRKLLELRSDRLWQELCQVEREEQERIDREHALMAQRAHVKSVLEKLTRQEMEKRRLQEEREREHNHKLAELLCSFESIKHNDTGVKYNSY